MKAMAWKSVAVGILWLAYAASFGALHGLLGSNTFVLATIPTILTAWLLGPLAGLTAALSGLIGSALLTARLDAGFDWAALLREDAATPLLLVVAGLGFGFAGRLERLLGLQRLVSDKAQYDSLTGLLNRRAFEERLVTAIDDAIKNGTFLAVLFVDLDRFKFVNDTYGHDVGDELLKAVAATLQEHVRENDLVARLGGDEFTLALPGLRDARAAAQIARKLVKLTNAPFEVLGKTIRVSASIGISICPTDGSDIETLIKNADSAMYQVKEAGKNDFTFSTQEVRARQTRRLELERRLHWALQDNEFEVRYQPILTLTRDRLVGFEALLRWNSPDLGLVGPEEFIPVAEEAGLIMPIGHWMLREACHQASSWQQAGYPPVQMAVNVSAVQFTQPLFLKQVADALSDTGLDADRLELEVTESLLMRDAEMAMTIMKKLRKLGVRTSLDDFGTGYSSLAYLQQLPINTLKIDRSFVARLGRPTEDEISSAAIVEAVCALAHKLGKKVIAEGVENEAQRRYLERFGCDYAQGFYFARPLKHREAEALLQQLASQQLAQTTAEREQPAL